MAQPWDDDVDSDTLDQLIRAYGRGEIDLWPHGPGAAAVPAGPAPGHALQGGGAAPQTQFSFGLTPAEYRGGLGAGFTPVSARLGVQAIPTPFPPPPLPAGDPNGLGKAFRDIWDGLTSLHPPPGTGARTSNPRPYEDECWDMHMDDTAECNRVSKQLGPDEGATCRKTASDRYGECLQGGPGRVRTPL